MVCCAVQKLVSQLSPRFYKLDEVSDEAFDEVVALMEKHDAAEVIISELNEIIHDKERFNLMIILCYMELFSVNCWCFVLHALNRGGLN